MDYAAHIKRICKIEDITVVEVSWGDGRAWRKLRKIRIRPVKTAKTYATALHEIGHILGRQRGSRLDKEVQAWEWAMQHALEWTQAMSDNMSNALESYLDWSERSRVAKRATPDHPIHALITESATSPPT